MKHNRQAQEELYLRFSYMMKGVCLRYSSNEADAEDLLQESFIKIFNNLRAYQETGKLGAWLRKITVNCALEKYRKEKKKKENTLLVADYGVHDFDFENALSKLELDDLLAKIQQLPNGYRTIFNLYVIEGYQHKEIAELLNISEGTSKSQYSRARILLKEMIEKEEKHKINNLDYAK